MNAFKLGVLQVIGSLLLFACMIFAGAKLESADSWVGVWIPFVIAGVALVVAGTIMHRPSARHWRGVRVP